MNARITYTYAALFLLCVGVAAGDEVRVKGADGVRMSADFDGSVARLIEAGAREISHQVGIKAAYAKSRWFLLPDMTCVWLASGDGKAVDLMEAGESGKGYSGKAVWLAQERSGVAEIKVVGRGVFEVVRETVGGEKRE